MCVEYREELIFKVFKRNTKMCLQCQDREKAEAKTT